jgi:TRAP-type C4-dicarboxylate transport system permease small subunit
MALAGGFGVMLAWHGWQLAKLNAMLTTPALQISMGWLYAALVTGGALIAICAVIAVLRPEDPATDRNVAV